MRATKGRQRMPHGRAWSVVLAAGLGLVLAAGGRQARAEGSFPAPWNVPWNVPGAAIPLAPSTTGPPPPYCTAMQRPPETDEDAQVVAAGWWLSSGYVSGRGITVVFAASDYGGMCQPAGNQEFVFAGGVFVGTLSPFGTGPDEGPPLIKVNSPDFLWATFLFLAAGDAFCCPSRVNNVAYGIDRSSGVPVLRVTSVGMATLTYNR